MSKFKKVKRSNYTVIDNSIFHNLTISFKAKGIHCQMLSLPDDWDYSLAGISKLAGDGIDSTRRGLEELNSYGYFEREYIRDEKGRVIDVEYIVYETPNDDVIKRYNEEKARKDAKKSINKKRKEISSNFKKNLENTKNADKKVRKKDKKEPETHVNTEVLENDAKTENPILDFPILDNPTQLNKKEINYKINKYIYSDSGNPSAPKKEAAPEKEPEPKINKQIESIAKEFSLSQEVIDTLKDFIQMRKDNNTPMSIRAIKILVKKLVGLSGDSNIQQQILEESILHGWKSVYPLREINDLVKSEGMMQHNYDFDKLEKDLVRN